MRLSHPNLIFTTILLIFSACDTGMESSSENPATPPSIIPRPLEMSLSEGSFALNAQTRIMADDAEAGQMLAELLSADLRLELPQATYEEGAENVIRLRRVAQDSLKSEAYLMQVNEKGIEISATQPAGFFRSFQSLRQLLMISAQQEAQNRLIPALTISDSPVYAYRGAMLDIARHFFGPEEIKRFIDLIALYKMNVLHLHLSDDQGWRIEIKSWPKLATYGGRSAVDGDPGGYLSQADYQDIVEYAARRHIMVIPEIDMPGHTNAALAAYPELNCDGQAPDLYTGIEVGFSSLCIDNEITYRFVDDVISELAAISPAPYIHIGGDESHVTEEDDYARFVERVQQIVSANGKRLIGWDEVSHAPLLEGTLVQHWADTANAELAVSKGARVILSPAAHAYMDMKYDSTTSLGLSWAGFTEVDDAYRWNPSQISEAIKPSDIAGIEAPLWTETIRTMDDIEYMIFPRLPGYAEIGWTPDSLREWTDYRQRLGRQGGMWEQMDVNFYRSELVPWTDGNTTQKQ